MFSVWNLDPNGIAVDEARGVDDPHQQRPEGQQRRHRLPVLPSYYGRLS